MGSILGRAGPVLHDTSLPMHLFTHELHGVPAQLGRVGRGGMFHFKVSEWSSLGYFVPVGEIERFLKVQRQRHGL